MKTVKLIAASLSFIILTSCGAQRVSVGNYDATDCKPIRHTEGKDIALFWEMVPLRTTEKMVNLTDYEKVVKRDFFDTVIFYGTAGIFSFKTVKIYVKDCAEEQ